MAAHSKHSCAFPSGICDGRYTAHDVQATKKIGNDWFCDDHAGMIERGVSLDAPHYSDGTSLRQNMNWTGKEKNDPSILSEILTTQASLVTNPIRIIFEKELGWILVRKVEGKDTTLGWRDGAGTCHIGDIVYNPRDKSDAEKAVLQ